MLQSKVPGFALPAPVLAFTFIATMAAHSIS